MADTLTQNRDLDRLEKSIEDRLVATDWERARPQHASQVPKLDPKLYDDIERLSQQSPQRAVDVWAKDAPKWATPPTAADAEWHKRIAEMRRLSRIDAARQDTLQGSIEIDGTTATAVRFEPSNDPKRPHTLTFSNGEKAVAKLERLDDTDLDVAVGERNSRIIQSSNGRPGVLAGQNLSYNAGVSPKELDRQIVEKEIRKGNLVVEEENEVQLLLSGSNGVHVRDIAATARHHRDSLPNDIASRYVQKGQAFYEAGNDKAPAFVDKGDKLVTSRNDGQVAHHMVQLAQARGWPEVELKGSPDFKRAAWIEAEAQGLKTRGYEPTAKDLEAAAHRRSIIEFRETSDITAPNGPLPRELKERARSEPEALKAAGIHSLARAVARELLEDPKLQDRFEKLVTQHLKERVESGRPLPEVRLKGGRQVEREDETMAREPELARQGR